MMQPNMHLRIFEAFINHANTRFKKYLAIYKFTQKDFWVNIMLFVKKEKKMHYMHMHDKVWIRRKKSK